MSLSVRRRSIDQPFPLISRTTASAIIKRLCAVYRICKFSRFSSLSLLLFLELTFASVSQGTRFIQQWGEDELLLRPWSTTDEPSWVHVQCSNRKTASLSNQGNGHLCELVQSARRDSVRQDDVPSPNAYQADLTRARESKRAFKPFIFASERFADRAHSADAPGYEELLTRCFPSTDCFHRSFSRPGSYECEVRQNRQVHMLHSFGGRTKLIPAIKTKCMPLNIDKVSEAMRFRGMSNQRCSLSIWAVCDLSTNTARRLLSVSTRSAVCELLSIQLALAREVQANVRVDGGDPWLTTLASFRYLQAFQKVRDCSQIHEHAGTSARIQVGALFSMSRWNRSFSHPIVSRCSSVQETSTQGSLSQPLLALITLFLE